MTTTLELTIDDLGAQADGIAHRDGKTIFVPGALPGERVHVRLSGIKNHAELLDILTPSPDRAVPPCPHFAHCGGCRLQHLNGKAVTTWKIHRLQETLTKAGLDNLPLQTPVITAPATRRRARFAAHHAANGIVLGFNAWHSHDVVDLTSCSILLPDLFAFAQSLRAKLPAWLPKGKACDVQITFLPDGADVVLIGGPSLGLDQRQTLALLADELDIAQLSWHKWDRSPIEPIAHRKPIFKTFGSTQVPFPPASFLQSTQTGEEALIAFAQNAVGLSKKIMDLFCGLGAFGLSMPNAQHFAFADADGQAIDALNRVAKHNPRWAVDKRNLISDPYDAATLGTFDAVIFDPPRGGAKALAAQLAKSRTPVIVAISCDPPTFARDAKILAQGGYKLRSLQPVDQFLWSTHLELAAWFEKRA